MFLKQEKFLLYINYEANDEHQLQSRKKINKNYTTQRLKTIIED